MITDISHRARLGRAAVAIKALRFAGILLLGLVLLPTLPLLGANADRLARWWYGRILRILGVEIATHGRWPAQAALIVANHCSWLDIVVLGQVFNAAFVSKAEIGGWPLVGRFARAGGTLFLDRGAGQTGDISRRIQAVLAAGRPVLFFPEGTTTADPLPQRFHARLFAPAIDGGFPVLPVALRYCDETTRPECHHDLAPWVNDEPIGPHFRAFFQLRRIRVDVRLCALFDPAGYDRRGLAEASRQAISHRQATAAQAARQPSTPRSSSAA